MCVLSVFLQFMHSWSSEKFPNVPVRSAAKEISRVFNRMWWHCVSMTSHSVENPTFEGFSEFRCRDDLLNPGETEELQSCNLYQRKGSGIPHKSSQTRMQSLIYEDGHINTPVGLFYPLVILDLEMKRLSSCVGRRDTSPSKQFDQ